MEVLFESLGPAFAAGLALQALIEWLDGPVMEPLTSMMSGADWPHEKRSKRKAGIVRTIIIVVSMALALALDIEVLEAFGQFGRELGLIDNLLAGLIVSMGTDGVNQVVKFVQSATERMDARA